MKSFAVVCKTRFWKLSFVVGFWSQGFCVFMFILIWVHFQEHKSEGGDQGFIFIFINFGFRNTTTNNFIFYQKKKRVFKLGILCIHVYLHLCSFSGMKIWTRKLILGTQIWGGNRGFIFIFINFDFKNTTANNIIFICKFMFWFWWPEKILGDGTGNIVVGETQTSKACFTRYCR